MDISVLVQRLYEVVETAEREQLKHATGLKNKITDQLTTYL